VARGAKQDPLGGRVHKCQHIVRKHGRAGDEEQSLRGGVGAGAALPRNKLERLCRIVLVYVRLEPLLHGAERHGFAAHAREHIVVVVVGARRQHTFRQRLVQRSPVLISGPLEELLLAKSNHVHEQKPPNSCETMLKMAVLTFGM
jgi:hypothetical protein